jgi:hypothetical protein
MKVKSTYPPVVPKGWTGTDFNKWRKFIEKQIDLINRTNVISKIDWK